MNGYVLASGPLPRRRHRLTADASYSYTFNWGGTSAFVANLSPPQSIGVTLLGCHPEP